MTEIPDRAPDLILKNEWKSKIWDLGDGRTVQQDNDGDVFWYLNGEFHREDGPAIEYANGSKYWYLNGKHHREDGPAVEYPESKYWWLNGKLHREDGPAIEYNSGIREWWLNGKFIVRGDKPENWTEIVLLAQVERVMDD